MSFKLPESFLKPYSQEKPPFGFGGMGEFVYKRTYSRIKEDGSNEEWWETIRRVVEGTFSMQKRHIEGFRLRWNSEKGLRHAKKMYDIFFNMKALPPGRGLWAMGTGLTEERKLHAALNNCGFVSTKDLAKAPSKPFEFLMDMSMLGVGVGFDVRGAGSLSVHLPVPFRKGLSISVTEVKFGRVEICEERGISYVIPDSREGWVESVRMLLLSFFLEGQTEIFLDYSEVREQGLLIKCFGGTSSGPEPLRKLHEKVRGLLEEYAAEAKCVDVRLITDIMNLIGKCVVAGNVRRTAEIVFGDPADEEYINLKDISVFPERNHWETGWGWTSNNSVFAELGMDYSSVLRSTVARGEPGFAWLKNMQKYGRMGDKPSFADWRALGGNPCLEQTLESFELCCLVETNPGAHNSLEDFLQTLKYAYMYAKTVTLGMTHWPETNRVMLRNRRIGASVTGVAQFADARGMEELREWLDGGYEAIQEYDKIYSEWFAVPRSIKTTSVKPSGTISKVMGVWAGMHRPDSRYIKRAIRVAADSPLLGPLQEAGYEVEPSVNDPERTMVVYFPIDMGPGRTNSEVTVWEQVSLAAFLQEWWADNQVSCTVSFHPKREASQIKHTLDHFQYRLKGISFLPRIESGSYPQMPEQGIPGAEFREMSEKIKVLNFSGVKKNRAVVEKFCDGDLCEIS